MSIKDINVIEDRAAIHKRVIGILQHHEKMKNSYFWQPPSGADDRRRYEEANSDAYCFMYNNDKINILMSTSCSCRNIYYKLNVTVNNGEENKTIKLLKKVLNKYPPIIVPDKLRFRYFYDTRQFECKQSGIIIDCYNQDNLKLLISHNTIIKNPGKGVILYRQDLNQRIQYATELVEAITYVTNDKEIIGFKNQEEINSYFFDKNL